jgi:bacterioferritin-associated ferredoxin
LRLILSIGPAAGFGLAEAIMDTCQGSDGCPADCGLRYVCRCLRVTEQVLAAALAAHDIRTLKDLKRHTGAGDGCMACHRRLKGYLERHPVTGPLAAAVA